MNKLTQSKTQAICSTCACTRLTHLATVHVKQCTGYVSSVDMHKVDDQNNDISFQNENKIIITQMDDTTNHHIIYSYRPNLRSKMLAANSTPKYLFVSNDFSLGHTGACPITETLQHNSTIQQVAVHIEPAYKSHVPCS